MLKIKIFRCLAAVLYLSLLAWSLSITAPFSHKRYISVACSSIEDLCREWADNFTANTGITVYTERISSGAALARISRQGSFGDFDVLHGGPADTYQLAKEQGLLIPYNSPEANNVPKNMKDPENYWSGVYLGVLGFCSNQRILKRIGIPAPTSWDDLLNSKLSGQLSVPNPVTSGTGYTMVWTNRIRTGSDNNTIKYFQQLNKNVLQYTYSGMSPSKIAGRGEAAVAVTFTQHCAKALGEGFKDLIISYPKEGTGYEIGSVAVLKGTHDLSAAKKYVDYALSDSAQQLGASTHSLQLPTRTDLPINPQLRGDAKLLPYSIIRSAADKPYLISQFQAKVFNE